MFNAQFLPIRYPTNSIAIQLHQSVRIPIAFTENLTISYMRISSNFGKVSFKYSNEEYFLLKRLKLKNEEAVIETMEYASMDRVAN